MPADFLSRNALEEIDMFALDLPLLQARDKFANAIIEFLQNNKLPADKKKAVYIKHIGQQCFLEDNILWRSTARCSHQNSTGRAIYDGGQTYPRDPLGPVSGS